VPAPFGASSIDEVAGIADQPLGSFVEEVARATPAPGGGSSAACACALGAALVEMAARVELGRGSRPGSPAQATEGGVAGGSSVPSDTPERVRSVRVRALELAERELTSYEPVLEALRLPGDAPRRAEILERALVEASEPPLAVVEAAAEVAELGLAVARESSPSVRGDALTGTLLAEAAAAAAASLVEINLGGRGAESLVQDARAARARARAAREAAEALAEPGGS
jgi:formiminotetrahydrofolate cyclodeaminase